MDDSIGQDSPPTDPVFKNVEEFVVNRFLPVYRRMEGDEIRWCHMWWAHAEAVSRLQALWHAWEVMRWEPGTGMGNWHRDHLDPQLKALLSPDGPFHACTTSEHREPVPLSASPAPSGWFEDEW
jgi:hypothetical protein